MPNVILATAGYDHTIRFWEVANGNFYRCIQLQPDSQVNQLKISPDKQFIAAAGNPHIRLFETTTNNSSPVTSFDGHHGNVTGIGFQKDGKWMYSSSEDGTIKIWDIRAPGCQKEFNCGNAVNTVFLHPNQAELISGQQNGSVRVWDLTQGSCSREIVPDGEVAIRSVGISPNATTAIAANNKGTVFVWKIEGGDTTNLTAIQKLQAHKTYLLKTVFSPNSKYFATTSADKTVKIWAMNNGQFAQLRTLTGHTKWVWDCVFSNDSKYLVSGSSDQYARLWDIQEGESIRHYAGHQKAITSVALLDN